MYLSEPLGWSESTQSDPSGAEAEKVAEPGICVQLAPWRAAWCRTFMTVGGSNAVWVIGAGGTKPGETDRGVSRATRPVRGVMPPEPEQPARTRLAATAQRIRERRLIGAAPVWRVPANPPWQRFRSEHEGPCPRPASLD